MGVFEILLPFLIAVSPDTKANTKPKTKDLEIQQFRNYLIPTKTSQIIIPKEGKATRGIAASVMTPILANTDLRVKPSKINPKITKLEYKAMPVDTLEYPTNERFTRQVHEILRQHSQDEGFIYYQELLPLEKEVFDSVFDQALNKNSSGIITEQEFYDLESLLEHRNQSLLFEIQVLGLNEQGKIVESFLIPALLPYLKAGKKQLPRPKPSMLEPRLTQYITSKVSLIEILLKHHNALQSFRTPQGLETIKQPSNAVSLEWLLGTNRLAIKTIAECLKGDSNYNNSKIGSYNAKSFEISSGVKIGKHLVIGPELCFKTNKGEWYNIEFSQRELTQGLALKAFTSFKSNKAVIVPVLNLKYGSFNGRSKVSSTTEDTQRLSGVYQSYGFDLNTFIRDLGLELLVSYGKEVRSFHQGLPNSPTAKQLEEGLKAHFLIGLDKIGLNIPASVGMGVDYKTTSWSYDQSPSVRNIGLSIGGVYNANRK